MLIIDLFYAKRTNRRTDKHTNKVFYTVACRGWKLINLSKNAPRIHLLYCHIWQQLFSNTMLCPPIRTPWPTFISLTIANELFFFVFLCLFKANSCHSNVSALRQWRYRAATVEWITVWSSGLCYCCESWILKALPTLLTLMTNTSFGTIYHRANLLRAKRKYSTLVKRQVRCITFAITA